MNMKRLWRTAYTEEGREKTIEELFVWVCVNTKTGEVEKTDIECFDDALSEDLCDYWEWQKFKLSKA